MAAKETTMVLKVDLQCPDCYKKIKKILCKFPQIRNRVYDDKANTVTITVVCCDPEKMRDKLCCKGNKVIKTIEIKDPPKTQPPKTDPPKTDPPKTDPPKTDPPKTDPPKTDPPKTDPPKTDPPKTDPPKTDPPKTEPPVVVYPRPWPYPVGFPGTGRTCCGPCSQGYGGGPCYHAGYGYPPPLPCNCGCGGYGPMCDYRYEESPSCSVM